VHQHNATATKNGNSAQVGNGCCAPDRQHVAFCWSFSSARLLSAAVRDKKKNATNTYTSDTEATISLSAEDNVTNVYVFFFSKCKTNEYFIKRHVNVKAKNDTQG
jgi:hypothetical protein